MLHADRVALRSLSTSLSTGGDFSAHMSKGGNTSLTHFSLVDGTSDHFSKRGISRRELIANETLYQLSYTPKAVIILSG
jgi:hypothetical protein